MSYLKLVFNFIKYLIIENPIKLLMVVASIVAREMRIFDMSDVYRLPKFSTKTQKRNNNLDKLGIN